MAILNILFIILGVGFLIFIHEFGHFICAKRAGVCVEAFSLGFGPVLLKFRRGDTEYRLSLIPLGGYVKMMGENPGEDHDPDDPGALHNKSAAWRLLIFSAGVLMNFFVMFPLLVVAFMIGVPYTAPLAGPVLPDTAEWNSPVKPGDRIVRIGDKDVRTFEQYLYASVLAEVGETQTWEVERDGERVSFDLTWQGGSPGLRRSIEPVIERVQPGSPAEHGGLASGDRVVAVNDEAVHGGYDLLEKIRDAEEGKLAFKVDRDGLVQTVDVVAPATETPAWGVDVTEVTAPRVRSIKADSPAARAGILSGDRIVSLGGRPVRSWSGMQSIIERTAGVPLAAVVDRGGTSVEIAAPVVPDDFQGRGVIGITQALDDTFDHVPADSHWSAAGLQAGDRIVRVAAVLVEPGAGFPELSHAARLGGQPVALTIERGGTEVELSLVPESRAVYEPIGVEPRISKVMFRAESIGDAVSQTWRESRWLFHITVGFFAKLVSGKANAKTVSGPVGIAQYSYTVISVDGWGKFLWLLALLSLNLAVINVLPIPVLDGGHIFYLFLEVLRGGKPVPIGVMVAGQYVGLLLLLGLIVYVTYQDIIRILQ